MKSLTKRVLGCVGAVTLMMVACSDDDISALGTGGSSSIGGSGGSGGGTAGTAGNGGQGGGGAGMAGSSSVAGSAGATTGGSGGSGGGNNAGSAGTGDAGVPDSGADPDGGGDSGTVAARTIEEVCTDYCASQDAYAAASAPSDAGAGDPECDGYDGSGCYDGCMYVGTNIINPVCAPQYKAMNECFTAANDWICDTGSVYFNGDCQAEQDALQNCH